MSRKNPTKAGDLAPHPSNPRTVTDAALAELGRSMRELGDLGGIVFNRRTGRLVGGTQRRRNIPDDAPIAVAQRFKKPTAAGTVAVGTIELEGELFSYREVDWPEDVELAANVRANNPAGEWDERMLSQVLATIQREGGDPSLTGFSQDRIAQLLLFAMPKEAPAEFPSINPLALETEHRCPRCAYEWSGNPKPESGAAVEAEAEA